MATGRERLGVDPSSFVAGDAHPGAVACLRSYYLDDYSGAWFERLADREHPFCFSARDIVAVSTLGVDVPARASIWLLAGAGRDATAALLCAIPLGTAIWDAGEDVLDEDSSASQLWELLRTQSGVGPVLAGKLMACKRPELIPIWDQWVGDALKPAGSFWLAMRAAFRDRTLRHDLASVRDEADLPCSPSLLRTLDVIVWMRRYGHVDSDDEDVRTNAWREPAVEKPEVTEVVPEVVSSRRDEDSGEFGFPFAVNKSFLARGEITVPNEFRPILNARFADEGPSWRLTVRSSDRWAVGSIRRGLTGGNRYYQVRVSPRDALDLLGPMQLGETVSVRVRHAGVLEVTLTRRG